MSAAVSDPRPVLFNFFDVVAFGVIFGCGALAVFLIGARSALVALVAFTVGASIPLAGFFLLGRMMQKRQQGSRKDGS